MKVGAIILSRLSSSRLPGKALMDLCGTPLVEHVVNLANKISGVDEVILATSEDTSDDELFQFAVKKGIKCFRGDLDNVQGRFLKCLEVYDLDGALRLNGDSPINNIQLLSKGVEIFRSKENLDLVSNVVPRTYPFGMSVECVSKAAMKRVANAPELNNFYKEHVTKFIYDFEKNFEIETIIAESESYKGIHLTVDKKEDLLKITKLISNHDTHLSELEISKVISIERSL